jgi:hypothetical protein
MPRPRQTYDDCVVVVFREITGEDKNSAQDHFVPHLTGESGISLAALSVCLKDAGWIVTPYDYAIQQVVEPDGSLSAAFRTFWTQFQGEAVVFYIKDDLKGHTILVRSGGVVFDPSPLAPENGEFIVDHFRRFPGKLTITSVSVVTRMLNTNNV